jgi:hypothetical protein
MFACVYVACFDKKDIIQCVAKWMAKNTVPVTIWGVPIRMKRGITFGDSP